MVPSVRLMASGGWRGRDGLVVVGDAASEREASLALAGENKKQKVEEQSSPFWRRTNILLVLLSHGAPEMPEIFFFKVISVIKAFMVPGIWESEQGISVCV